MLLYDAARPNPRAVRIVLLEKAITLPIRDMDVDGGENRLPDFVSRNPGGQMPVLKLDSGIARKCARVINEVKLIKLNKSISNGK